MMDTGEGKFMLYERLEDLEGLKVQYPRHKGVFTVGEEIEIKGSLFRVKDISPFGIKFKLLPAKPQSEDKWVAGD